jgi:hypothetical protein
VTGKVRVVERFPPNLTRQETPKKCCGTYIGCMSIERMRERLAADRASFNPASRHQPTSLRPGHTGFTRSSTTATG